MWLDLFLMRLVVLAVGGLVALVGGWCAGGWCNAGGGLWWCWDGTGARLAELAHAYPGLPLVVISALTSPDVVRRTLDIASVHAFVPKSAPSVQISAAIHAALRGHKLPFAHRAPQARRPEVVLTPRMEEVRQLLRQGMSNKLIARTLGISEGTVKNHMSEIFKALQVSNRTQAAQLDAERL